MLNRGDKALRYMKNSTSFPSGIANEQKGPPTTMTKAPRFLELIRFNHHRRNYGAAGNFYQKGSERRERIGVEIHGLCPR